MRAINPATLKGWIGDGRELAILDAREEGEFGRSHLFWAVPCPLSRAELRGRDLLPRLFARVCCVDGGEGGLAERLAAFLEGTGRGDVSVLEGGTPAWERAGLVLFSEVNVPSKAFGEWAEHEHGTPSVDATELDGMRRSGADVVTFAAARGVETIDAAGLQALLAERDRTLYLLDVRDPSEYAAGHLPGSRSAPGGQLVQATDRWIAVRGARIVLVDDDGVRASMAGGWLRELDGGWEVHALRARPEDLTERGGPRPAHCPEAAAVPVEAISPEALPASSGAEVVQLPRSLDFREGHIAGARWGVRTRLAKLAPFGSDERPVVLAAEDDTVARLAVLELRGLTTKPVRVLEGGMPAWRAAGLPLRADRRTPPDAECVDAYLRPYDRNEGVEAAMREYLSWEVDLIREVARDGDARFGGVRA